MNKFEAASITVFLTGFAFVLAGAVMVIIGGNPMDVAARSVAVVGGLMLLGSMIYNWVV